MIKLRELIVILDLHKQGLTISAIAERTRPGSQNRSQVHRARLRGACIRPTSAARAPHGCLAHYVRERLSAYAELTIARLLREIRALGYAGGKTMLGDFVREVRSLAAPLFEVRFETAPVGCASRFCALQAAARFRQVLSRRHIHRCWRRDLRTVGDNPTRRLREIRRGDLAPRLLQVVSTSWCIPPDG